MSRQNRHRGQRPILVGLAAAPESESPARALTLARSLSEISHGRKLNQDECERSGSALAQTEQALCLSRIKGGPEDERQHKAIRTGVM